MAPKTDLDLVESFRNGDISGFNELVGRYQEKVYWIARRVVGSHEDADDVVQDVFVRMFKALGGFRGESGFYTWLYRITMRSEEHTSELQSRLHLVCRLLLE